MFDAYKIAIHVGLVNNASSGLTTLSRQFQGASSHAQQFNRQLARSHALMQAGSTAMAAGKGLFLGVAGALKTATTEALSWEKQVLKFKMYGLGDELNGQAIKFARGMNIIGTSYSDNMRLMTEAQGVFRESALSGPAALRGSMLAAPMLAKIEAATAAMEEGAGAKHRASSMAMLRFVEMEGGLASPEKFMKIANSGWKAIQSSGGNIDWEQLRQFKARAGVAGQNLNDNVLYGKLEPIIGELKGSTAGFALRTSYNRLMGVTRLPNQVAHMLADNGIWDKKRIEWNSQGGVKRFNGNPLMNSELFARDPIEFYKTKVLPMYQRTGVHSQEERARNNAMIFGSTGGMLFNLIDRQMKVLEKSEKAWEKALDVDASHKVTSESGPGKFNDLHKKWKDTLVILGEIVLPVAIRGVEKLIQILKPIGEFMEKNPAVVTGVIYGLIGLAGAMAVGGLATNIMALMGLVRFLRLSGPALAAAQAIGGVGAGAAGAGAAGAGAAGAAAGAAGLAKAARVGLYGAAAWGAWQIGKTGLALKDLYDIETREGVQLSQGARARLSGAPNGSSMATGGSININLNVDGKKMASVVTDHMGRDLSRPTASTSLPDYSHSMPRPSGGFSK